MKEKLFVILMLFFVLPILVLYSVAVYTPSIMAKYARMNPQAFLAIVDIALYFWFMLVSDLSLEIRFAGDILAFNVQIITYC